MNNIQNGDINSDAEPKYQNSWVSHQMLKWQP